MSKLRKRGIDRAFVSALVVWVFATIAGTWDIPGRNLWFSPVPWGQSLVYGFFVAVVVFIVMVLFPEKQQPDQEREENAASNTREDDDNVVDAPGRQ